MVGKCSNPTTLQCMPCSMFIYTYRKCVTCKTERDIEKRVITCMPYPYVDIYVCVGTGIGIEGAQCVIGIGTVSFGYMML